MEKTKNDVKVDTRHVITADGLRMTYKEYIEMRNSERW